MELMSKNEAIYNTIIIRLNSYEATDNLATTSTLLSSFVHLFF